jgi:hypothetical protein
MIKVHEKTGNGISLVEKTEVANNFLPTSLNIIEDDNISIIAKMGLKNCLIDSVNKTSAAGSKGAGVLVPAVVTPEVQILYCSDTEKENIQKEPGVLGTGNRVRAYAFCSDTPSPVASTIQVPASSFTSPSASAHESHAIAPPHTGVRAAPSVFVSKPISGPNPVPTPGPSTRRAPELELELEPAPAPPLPMPFAAPVQTIRKTLVGRVSSRKHTICAAAPVAAIAVADIGPFAAATTAGTESVRGGGVGEDASFTGAGNRRRAYGFSATSLEEILHPAPAAAAAAASSTRAAPSTATSTNAGSSDVGTGVGTITAKPVNSSSLWCQPHQPLALVRPVAIRASGAAAAGAVADAAAAAAAAAAILTHSSIGGTQAAGTSAPAPLVLDTSVAVPAPFPSTIPIRAPVPSSWYRTTGETLAQIAERSVWQAASILRRIRRKQNKIAITPDDTLPTTDSFSVGVVVATHIVSIRAARYIDPAATPPSPSSSSSSSFLATRSSAGSITTTLELQQPQR